MKKNVQYLDLTDAEIEEYRKKGYVVEELDKFPDGGKVSPGLNVSPENLSPNLNYNNGNLNINASTGISPEDIRNYQKNLFLNANYNANLKRAGNLNLDGSVSLGNGQAPDYNLNANYNKNFGRFGNLNLNGNMSAMQGQPNAFNLSGDYNVNLGKGNLGVNGNVSSVEGQPLSYSYGARYRIPVNNNLTFNAGYNNQSGVNAGLRYTFPDGGSVYKTKLNEKDEKAFQKFFNTLPENLRSDDESYDIRGYWDAEGRPSEFDYSQPKESDGYYHAYSVNPNTGEYLKAPWHDTFKLAVNEDRNFGYRPVVLPTGRIKAAYNPNIIHASESFLINQSGPTVVENNSDSLQPVTDSNTFLSNWFNSPKHAEMLAASFRKQYPDYSEEQIQNEVANTVKQRVNNLKFNVNYKSKSEDGTLGEAFPLPEYDDDTEFKPYLDLFTNEDRYNNYVKTHESRHMSDQRYDAADIPMYDKQKWFFSTPEKLPEAKGIHFDYNKPYEAWEKFKDTNMYKNAEKEYNATNKSVPYSEFLKTEDGKNFILDKLKTLNYYSQPAELTARKDAILHFAKDNNIYDPFTEQMTPEILQKIKNKMKKLKGVNQLEQLEQRYSDEELLELFNTLAKNDNSSDIMVAKNGGAVKSWEDELTEDEINWYKSKGYRIEELD